MGYYSHFPTAQLWTEQTVSTAGLLGSLYLRPEGQVARIWLAPHIWISAPIKPNALFL